MRKLATIAVALAAGTAYGISFGAGGFYTVSAPFLDWYETSFLGGGGKVSVGVLPDLSVDVGFGYNAKYKEDLLVFPDIPPIPWPPLWQKATVVDENNWYLTIIPITFGASYKFDLGKVKPYVGAGGVFAIRKRHYEAAIDAESPNPVVEPKTYTAVTPGFYVGGGVMYGLTDKLFLDANPRFLMLMYNEAADDAAPNVGKDNGNLYLVDFLIGVNYYFM